MKSFPAISMFSLPEHISERCEIVGSKNKITSNGPVVIWLKSSLRVHENPAIDAGRLIASSLGLPVFVYQGIDERYPHSSPRHHKVLLDAAVDMEKGCKQLELDYFLNVSREENRGKALHDLGKIASIIITDLFPLPPWKDWVKSVARSADCPVLQVDCHCVVPMPVFGKSMDRPFRYRDATKKLRKRRIGKSWPLVEVENRSFEGVLPFKPVDIDKDIVNSRNGFDLISKCDIDMTNHPVWDFKGGEIEALRKWNEFLLKGIHGYARRRNNAADPEGVSRLSSAIHYGFISTMKIAREASDVGTKSAEKFLDELMIFREHAWHHVYSCSDPYGVENLPQWARDSWITTSDDPRYNTLDKYELELGKSESDLWNLCQTSLLRHGELHNNLRMTWGKAIPQWTSDVETSMEMAQHLNDRYALDGRDPSSVAGVQWCHGLFDRAFYPPLPVMGVVRKRDIETHKSRLDFSRYESYVTRKPIEQKNPIVIIGAGYSGAYSAFILNNLGYDVKVVDKGTIPGGRSSTKIRPTGAYNHGNSQFYRIDEATHLFDNISERNQAHSNINSLLSGIEVDCQITVKNISESEEKVTITTEGGHEIVADGVIVTCPLPQSFKLMENLPNSWENYPYDSNWTLIVTGPSICPELSKTQTDSIQEIRYGLEGEQSNNLIIHMKNEWSKENLEDTRQEVIEKFMQLARLEIDDDLFDWIQQSEVHAHRWRFSRPTIKAHDPGLFRVKFAGDAFAHPIGTVEGAIRSAKLATLDLAWSLDSLQEKQKKIIQSKLF